MSDRIRLLADQCYKTGPIGSGGFPEYVTFDYEKFAELIKQAIYDTVKEEWVEQADIDDETNIETKRYLQGCNGGIVDALCIIKSFGEEE